MDLSPVQRCRTNQGERTRNMKSGEDGWMPSPQVFGASFRYTAHGWGAVSKAGARVPVPNGGSGFFHDPTHWMGLKTSKHAFNTFKHACVLCSNRLRNMGSLHRRYPSSSGESASTVGAKGHIQMVLHPEG